MTDMKEYPFTAISLGAGVQSTTLLLMAMAGKIDGQTPDCAIFADTGWEPAAVYEHLAWLESISTIPIYRVSGGNLRDDTIAVARRERDRVATAPFYIKSINGKREGMLRRQCTAEYKIAPIKRKLRKLYPSANAKNPLRLWLGISWDESQRQKKSMAKYIEHRWPFLEDETRMTRADCIAWIADHDYPAPPRSACIGCPFRRNDEWRNLTPTEFQDAVDFDRSIRTLPRVNGDVYLHRSLIPLDEVDFRTKQEQGQLEMFDEECEGMCGL